MFNFGTLINSFIISISPLIIETFVILFFTVLLAFPLIARPQLFLNNSNLRNFSPPYIMTVKDAKKPSVMRCPNLVSLDSASNSKVHLNLRAVFSTPLLSGSKVDIASNHSPQSKPVEEKFDNDLVLKQSSSFIPANYDFPIINITISDYTSYRHKLMEGILRKKYRDQQPPGHVILNSKYFNSKHSQKNSELKNETVTGNSHSFPQKESPVSITDVFKNSEMQYFHQLEHFLIKGVQSSTLEKATETKNQDSEFPKIGFKNIQLCVLAKPTPIKAIINESQSVSRANQNLSCNEIMLKNYQSCAKYKFKNRNSVSNETKSTPVVKNDGLFAPDRYSTVKNVIKQALNENSISSDFDNDKSKIKIESNYSLSNNQSQCSLVIEKEISDFSIKPKLTTEIDQRAELQEKVLKGIGFCYARPESTNPLKELREFGVDTDVKAVVAPIDYVNDTQKKAPSFGYSFAKSIVGVENTGLAKKITASRLPVHANSNVKASQEKNQDNLLSKAKVDNNFKFVKISKLNKRGIFEEIVVSNLENEESNKLIVQNNKSYNSKNNVDNIVFKRNYTIAEKVKVTRTGMETRDRSDASKNEVLLDEISGVIDQPKDTANLSDEETKSRYSNRNKSRVKSNYESALNKRKLF